MSAQLTAAARTPLVPRHGALATARPDVLLSRAIEAAVLQRGLDPQSVELLLVACDTAVGALDLNIGRRAALELGWTHLAALTVDGQQCGDLALAGLAASLEKVCVVAAVDLPSTVPPGAGLVRDYGRPTVVEPRFAALERLAREAGLTGQELDLVATGLRSERAAHDAGVVGMEVAGGPTVTADAGMSHGEEGELMPLSGEGGLLTAHHEAVLADGAVAVVIEPGGPAPTPGRPLITHGFAGTATGDAVSQLQRLAEGDAPLLLAEGNAVIHALVGPTGHASVSSVFAVGSAPSADGLRMVCDGFHAVDTGYIVARQGGGGQWAHVAVGAP